MGETRVYKLNLNVGDATFDTLSGPDPGHPSYRSSAWGGSNPPTPGYPEFGEMENVERKENAGASGQHVMDASVTTDYTVSWITMCGVGPLINGQWDARGGGAGKPLKCRWKQFLRSSALAEADYSSWLCLCNGGRTGSSSGLFSTNVFIQIEVFRTSGSSYDLYVGYMSISGSLFYFTSTLIGTGAYDDAEHEMVVTIVPSTVTGAYAPNPAVGPGSAVVASDGSWSLSIDGAVVGGQSGIQFVINPYAITNPDVYYGKTIWHGD